jgi:hypothetical protein
VGLKAAPKITQLQYKDYLSLFRRPGRACVVFISSGTATARATPGTTTCPNIASLRLILAGTGSARKKSNARTIKKPSNKRCEI